jgi:prepilin-type N-terminal cleavage/methylation domain-containing protein
MRDSVGKRALSFQKRDTSEAGFTLIELLVAAVIFTIITGAAFSLFALHQPVFNQQQNLAEVNIALRNAVAQMQLDISNAGANYYTGINIPNYPVGVVVTNNPVASGGDCRSGTPLAYGTNCFDAFSLVTADSATLPANPSTSAGACVTTSNAATIYLGPPAATGGQSPYATAALATAAAANYKSGDQILFVKNDGSQYTTMKLSANATTGTIGVFTNRYVTLTSHTTTSTTAPGLNTSGASGPDKYDMTTHANSMLGESFCSTDWVLRITPIQYGVDISDPTNPTLTRTIAGVTQTLSQKTLATQIIGFKVGVSLFNNTTDTDTTIYNFDAATYDNGSSVPYNYTLVRSVMVSLVGRTKPVTDPTYKFRNTFDQGRYEIQGVSVVVNPRNMSMTD